MMSLDKRHRFYLKLALLKEGLEQPILLTSSKFQPCLLQKTLKRVKRIRNDVLK